MSRNVKTSLIFATLGMASIVLLLLFELRTAGTDARQGAETRLSASIGGAFALTDQNGIRRSQADFAGRPTGKIGLAAPDAVLVGQRKRAAD